MTTATSPNYVELLQLPQPSMPQTAAEHQRLVDILESIELDGHHLSEAELRFTEMVKVLVLEYEDQVSPMADANPLQMLHFVVEQKAMRQADFVEEFGSKSYVNQIFHGSRPITKGVAQKLAKVLGVDVKTFVPR